MKKCILLLLSFSISVICLSQGIGIGTLTPNSSAVLETKSTTQGFLPPRMTTTERNLIATPAEGLMIYNTSTKRINFFDGTDWIVLGSPVIGSEFKGGILVYTLVPGDIGYSPTVPHGLIAAQNDLTMAEWGCYGSNLPGTGNVALGAGNNNTSYIMIGCATAGIAARQCGDLVLNGYSDWFLPSKNELNLLYLNRNSIGNFTGDYYWSSTQDADGAFPTQLALCQNFSNGFQAGDNKYTPHRVRAVRYF